MTARVGIIGATGYAGSETVRWLLGHPEVEVASMVSSTRAGTRLDAVLPSLYGYTDLVLEAFDPTAMAQLDAVLIATPHGAAAPLVAELEQAPRILDLSRDHRHAPGWTYGLVEWAELDGATRIAVPGCFATAIALAVAPFVAAGVVEGPVCVAAATGSTGSGASAKAATHHPERFVNLRAYKVLNHQHVPEILGVLGDLGTAPELHFVPLSAPVDRGIFATCFVPVGEADAASLLQAAYAEQSMIRVRPGSPQLRHVRGTGLADLSVHQDGSMAAVLSAIDNLGKGAAAQAVQCLNRSLGLPVDTGLTPIPLTP